MSFASNNPSDFPVFSRIDRSSANGILAKLIRLMENLPSVLGTDVGRLTSSQDVLLEIFDRIEKRRVYFHVFYKGCKMGELNEGSLLCFWIAKLQPFHHPGMDSSKLNAKISVCLFVNTIYFHSERTRQEKRIPEHFINDLYYSLLYRDISKESLMLLAESFLDKKPLWERTHSG